jgi:hypothetical protein
VIEASGEISASVAAASAYSKAPNQASRQLLLHGERIEIRPSIEIVLVLRTLETVYDPVGHGCERDFDEHLE